MKPLTDAEKARMLIGRAAADNSDESRHGPRERVRKRIGISKVRLWKLLRDGGNLKQGELRKRLDLAWHTVFVEPGTLPYREWVEEIRSILGDGRAGLPDVTKMDQFLIEPAFHIWSKKALNPRLSPSDRLHLGTIAQRVMFDWLKHNKRLASAGKMFTVPDTEVYKRGLEVVEAMVEIVASHRQAPPGFFSEGSDVARRNGYRMFRVRLASNHLGWIALNPSLPLADRVAILTAAYRRGVHEDMAWLSTIQPDEIAWLFNAWVMAIHAGDWTGSVKLAVQLFTKWPAILTTPVFGLKPVKDNPDTWPGIAAILEDSDADALDGLRGQLTAGDLGLANMMGAMSGVRLAVAAGTGYLEALAAVNKGDMK